MQFYDTMGKLSFLNCKIEMLSMVLLFTLIADYQKFRRRKFRRKKFRLRKFRRQKFRRRKFRRR